ncbi:restriction endonuclease subunit S [Luteimonas qiangzhengi]|uniref:restriction endonuclease subunit S n=1 Tax=Luteimonas sp. MJ146 TaxID=3129240 RepID=UPI0031BB1EB6
MVKQRVSAVTPRLRFPEFRQRNPWTVIRLGEVLKIGNGRDYKHLEEGPIPVYGSGGYMLSVNDYLYDGESACIGRKGTIDKPIFLAGKFWTVDTLFYTHSFTNCLPYFVYLYFQQIDWLKHNEAGGVPSLSKTNIEKIEVAIPDVTEQQEIADCLTSLDEVIAAQGRKVEALKTHKRGLMQQLFPREGETRPRLRFPEFRDAPEWQKTPLGRIAEIKLGKMLDANKHKSGRLLPYVNNLSLRWNEVDTSDLPQMYFKESELERFGLRRGDVLVCEGGEPGRSAVWDGRLPDLKFQKAVHRVRFNLPVVPKILVLYLEAIAGTAAFESLFTGGGIKHLTGETFSKLSIPLTNFPEQQRIADCFSSVDTQITAETNQLVALKTHKHGLMQQLFPAPEAISA